MFRPGASIGRYQVVGPIGRGDPDGLFEVTDLAGRPFAMRSPIGDLEDDDAVTRRFAPVAEALRSVAHLNLVALLDVFVHGGQLYLILERVGGRSLQTAIADGVTPRQALMIIRQALEGAAHAHALGRVHRDLRPSKLLLVPMGGWDLVKVADFGLGMMIDEVVIAFGAPALTGSLPSPAAAYMAPEQVLGRSVDPRTDIYSLGVILFELLAERQPFPDSDPELVRRLQVTMPAPRLDEIARGADWCTPDVLTLVETALAKERDDRFQNAGAMMIAVDRAYRSIQHLPE
jgi:eukaryotic-like serine/threonine-protein kinase